MRRDATITVKQEIIIATEEVARATLRAPL